MSENKIFNFRKFLNEVNNLSSSTTFKIEDNIKDKYTISSSDNKKYVEVNSFIPEKEYNKLCSKNVETLTMSEVDKDIVILCKLADYKDSKALLKKYEERKVEIENQLLEEKYLDALKMYNNTDYKKALVMYKELADYKDSKEKVVLIEAKLLEIAKEEKYLKAEELYSKSDYQKALVIYKELADYKDSKEKVVLIEAKLLEIAKEEKYLKAEELYAKSDYQKALVMFKELVDYKDSKEKVVLIEAKLLELEKKDKYSKASALIKKANYTGALVILKELVGYKDSNELADKCNYYILEEENYKKASNLNKNYKYDEAYEFVKDSTIDKNKKLATELKQKLDLYKKYSNFNHKKATIIELQNAISELKPIAKYKNVESLISLYSSQISLLEKKKAIAKIGIILGSAVAVIALIVVLVVTVVVPNNKYDDALNKVNNKDYSSAEELLSSLDGHKDSENVLKIISALKELDTDVEKGVNDLLALGVKVTAKYSSKYDSRLESVEFSDKYYVKEHELDKYNLIGWELTDYAIDVTSSYSVTINLKGIYELKLFTITYNLAGGKFTEVTYPTKYSYGGSSEILLIPTPYKEGHEFVGWESNNKNVYLTNQGIKLKSYGDVTLTAIFKAKEYKVTFDVNGGVMPSGPSTFDLTITYGDKVEVLEPTRVGYKFVGWYCGDVLLDEESFNFIEDCIIKAKWEIINYAINYTGDDVNEENPLTITYEDVITLKPVEKTGYKFIGWNYNNEIYEELELKNITDDITLEALFTPNDYTITLDPSGGVSNLEVNINYYISGELYSTQTLKPGEKVQLLYLTNGDSVISGWYLDPEYRNKFDERIPVEKDINLYGYYSYRNYINPTSYSSGRPYTMTCPIMGGTNTIYVRAKVSGTFTIYYKSASTTSDYNGDKETYISISNRTRGISYVGKEILESKSSYRSVTVSCLQGDEIEINCWKVKSSGIGSSLNIYFSGYNNTSSNIVAADEINKIAVTYDGKVTLPTPTKEGYEFLGWYLNDELFDNEVYNVASDVTLVAKWK